MRISLIPAQGEISLEAEVRRRHQVFALTVALAAIVSVALVGVTFLFTQVRARQIAGLKTKLDEVSAKVASEQSRIKDFTPVVKVLQAGPSLLDAHVDPVPLFVELEKKTIPTVSYKTITLRADEVILEVIAPDYPTAARQVLAYHQSSEVFTKVVAPSYRGTEKLETDEPHVRFNVTLTLKSGALQFK